MNIDEERMIIPKGKFFILTMGEYSHYTVKTLCKAINDLNIKSLQKEYLSQYPEQEEEYCFEYSVFRKWLIVDKKLAEEVCCFEWHLANYDVLQFTLEKAESREK